MIMQVRADYQGEPRLTWSVSARFPAAEVMGCIRCWAVGGRERVLRLRVSASISADPKLELNLKSFCVSNLQTEFEINK